MGGFLATSGGLASDAQLAGDASQGEAAAASTAVARQKQNEGRNFTTKGLIVVPAGEGEPRWIATSRITLKATAAQTNGGYGLIVSEVTRGSSSPLHVHHTAEEGIWVVSGRILVRCGTDDFTLGADGCTAMPRGIPHTFLAEEDTTMLGLITPGGTEGYFAEGGPVATTPTPPAPDLERLHRAAEKYQCEIVGPPLTPRT